MMKKFSRLVFAFFLLCVTSGYTTEAGKAPMLLVTCATGELGSAIAKELARDNNLILSGRNTSKLQELQRELQAECPWSYEIVKLDYCSPESLLDFADFLEAREGEISGLVLMTPRPNFGSDLLQSESDWLSLFQTTFTGPVEALKGVLPCFASKSKIVIIGGTTSVQLMPEYGPACMVRRMWATYAKALSHRLGPEEISVNVLSPGVVLTHFHEKRIANKAQQNGISCEEQMEREVAHIPMQRYVTPGEVAKTVAFLLSGDSNFINGVNLVIDGGATVSY